MCEAGLAKVLRSRQQGVEDLAPQLLVMADEAGLRNLCNAALDHVSHPTRHARFARPAAPPAASVATPRLGSATRSSRCSPDFPCHPAVASSNNTQRICCCSCRARRY